MEILRVAVMVAMVAAAGAPTTTVCADENDHGASGASVELPPPGATTGTFPAREPIYPATEPVDDRWKLELPPYKLNSKGHWWDPYNQNWLKGDFPFLGEDIFLKLTGI